MTLQSNAAIAPDTFPRELRVRPSLRAATPSERRITVALVLLYVALRLKSMVGYGLTFDEVWSVNTARFSWRELLVFESLYDFHPPLFTMLAKAWIMLGGESYGWIAMLPIGLSLVTLVPLFALFRELRLTPGESHFTLFALAVNGYIVNFAQEFRMYSLLLLLTVCSLLAFVRLCNAQAATNRHLVVLGVVNLIAVYTQHFSWLVIASQLLFLLYWDRRKFLRLAAVTLLLVLACVPWLVTVVSSALNRPRSYGRIFFNIHRPGLFDLAFFYAVLNGALTFARATTVSVLLFALPLLACWLHLWRARPEDHAFRSTFAWLTLCAFFPAACAFAASQVLPTAVWGQRHLIIVAVPYLLAVTLASFRLPKVARGVTVAVLVAWIAASGVRAAQATYRKVGWDELLHQLAAATASADRPVTLYTADDDDATVLSFYANRQKADQLKVVLLEESSGEIDFYALGHLELMATDHLDDDDEAPPRSLLVIDSLRNLPERSFWIADEVAPISRSHPVRSLRGRLVEAGFTVHERSITTAVSRRWNVRQIGIYEVQRGD